MEFTKEVYEEILRRDEECPLEAAVDRAVKLHNKILSAGGVGDSSELMWRSGEIDVMWESHVAISWEKAWQYGGQDDGYYNIPLSALLDESWQSEVTRISNDVLKDIQEKAGFRARKIVDERLKMYEELKKEFE